MVKKHIKIFPTSLNSKEMRKKTIVRYHTYSLHDGEHLKDWQYQVLTRI